METARGEAEVRKEWELVFFVKNAENGMRDNSGNQIESLDKELSYYKTKYLNVFRYFLEII